MREDVKIEGARDVAALLLVKGEGADAPLKGIHPHAIVLDFLVAVLHRVVLVRLVLQAYRES